MNIFVVVYFKRPGVSVAEAALLPYLPISPRATDEWRAGNACFFAFACGRHESAPLIRRQSSSAMVHDGILVSRDGDDTVPAEFVPDSFSGFGEFCLAWSDGKVLRTFSNVGASNNLYVTETGDFIAISNRSVMLLGLPGVSHEIDPRSVGWKAFQGYVSGPGTAFTAIRKLAPGARTQADARGFHVVAPTVSELIAPATRERARVAPLEMFDAELDRIAQYMDKAHAALGRPPIEVPLSGGKDSRTILALLIHAGLKTQVAQIWTRGPAYSPEVLAAQDICKALQFEQHVVRRPPHVAAASVRAGMFVNSMNLTEGMLSCYDFSGIGPREHMLFHGHELGLRAGRFAAVPVDSLDAFIAGTQRVLSNPLQVVRDLPYHRGWLAGFFREHHAQGADVEDLGDVYALFDRLPSWAAVMSTGEYCSGPISNPLLEGTIFRFAFNLPAQYRRSELFQYLALARIAPNLLSVPFADQQWPEDQRRVVESLGIAYVPGPAPYRSRPYFPNVSNPYLPNTKLTYLRAFAPVIVSILEGRRAYFDQLIDVDGFKAIVMDENRKISFPVLYACLGVYSAAILEEYGSAIFDRERRPSIIADLDARVAATSQSAPSESAYLELLERHENAIAALMREAYRP